MPKQIPLTQGKVAIVDDEFYDTLMQWRWCAHKDRRAFYAKRTIHRNGKYKASWMHRFILELAGIPLLSLTDHRDGNGLNNTLDNLRPATPQQNGRNCFLAVNNTSGYKGVSFHKRDKKWCAYIQVDSKIKKLGQYNNPEDAAAAYNVAAIEFHGEFARVNPLPNHLPPSATRAARINHA